MLPYCFSFYLRNIPVMLFIQVAGKSARRT